MRILSHSAETIVLSEGDNRKISELTLNLFLLTFYLCHESGNQHFSDIFCHVQESEAEKEV